LKKTGKKWLWFLLVLQIFIFACAPRSQNTSHLSPKTIDGVLTLGMNRLGDEARFFGEWSAPRLGRGFRFYRFLLKSDTGFDFELLKKEACLVEVDLYNEVSSLKIGVNERIFPISGLRFRKLVPADDLKIGKNKIRFTFPDTDRIAIHRINILPKRFHKFFTKNYNAKRDFLTPVRFHYYLNPQKKSKLKLSYNFPGRHRVDGKITIESERNKKEYPISISSNKGFQISMLDETLHHIKIEIPEIDSRIIKLVQSQWIEPKEKRSGLADLQNIAKNKNILIILLDAARADHMSCYGYHRNTTPNIDAMAKKGFRFNYVFAEAAFTLASTGTLLTGLPPDIHGVISTFQNRLRNEIITLPELFQKEGYFTGAISANPYFGETYNFQKGFDQFIELSNEKNVIGAEEFLEPFENMVKDLRDRPFFIYLHLREPHHPYLMPKPFFGRYQKKFDSYSEPFDEESSRIYFGQGKSPEDFQFITDVYDENLAYADHIAGKILNLLKRHYLFDDTITIVTADHGEALGERNMVGHNVILHREGIHVPLIIHIPDAKMTPQVVDNPAITSDLVITLCDLLEIKYPYPELTRGRNLFSLPRKRTRISRSASLPDIDSSFMVDSFPYRAIIFQKLNQLDLQLFDIKTDPNATRVLTNGQLQKNAMKFFLSSFIDRTTIDFRPMAKPALGEAERKRLKALGYIK
jgi:arylsulfatase